MNQIVKSVAAAALALSMVALGLPGISGGGATVKGTGSTGCCKQ